MSVSITNDGAFEDTEEFKGAIALGASQDGIAEITVPEATVTINDDDGMLKFLIFSILPLPSLGALKLFSGTIYQTQINTQQK